MRCDMLAVRIVFLCVGAAMVCTMLRMQRPEMAAMLSLAVGIGVLLLSGDAMQTIAGQIRRFMNLTVLQHEEVSTVLKAAGISILSELGVQICTDAGEGALAGRIRLACRLTMLMLAMPSIVRIMDCVSLVLG